MAWDDAALLTRIESRLTKDPEPDGCWHWTGYIDPPDRARGGGPKMWIYGYPRQVLPHFMRIVGRQRQDDEYWQRTCPSADCLRPEHWTVVNQADFCRELLLQNIGRTGK